MRMKRPVSLKDLEQFEVFCQDVIAHSRAIGAPLNAAEIQAMWSRQDEPSPEQSPKGMPHYWHTEENNEIERVRNERERFYLTMDDIELDM